MPHAENMIAAMIAGDPFPIVVSPIAAGSDRHEKSVERNKIHSFPFT
jgi:acyl dehydratase